MIVLTSDMLEAHILPRGATLAGLWMKGIRHSLTLGFEQAASFEACPIYAGALVGPVANRVADGRVQIGSRCYRMPANEGTTCLHSGDHGFHALEWNVSRQSARSVTLQLELPHMANGLPGRRVIAARYDLLPGATLALTITASSDRDTVMNVAHHPYWCLDGHRDVSRHRLQIDAESYLPVTGAGLPTGQITPVAGTSYDFRTPRSVPVDRSLDANLCLSRAATAAPRRAASLTGSNGLTLGIETTEPGLQVYNGSGLPDAAPKALQRQKIGPFAGIALEPQGWPDAPNHPEFPRISLTAGAHYSQETLYRFTNN
ncbi:galactose mutarotase [Roseobacter sp. YSTF-M11]|uniref:Galactose mutarotase n=1 Tax=Roseobacter insulae TaxID=2859783 RepID=A0A9X1FUN2_9RHOB|nr:aldose epimerase family protein [Roseobacter insulae]MBW4708099.1 galactose mutarotase [Roseobacter insulae]